MSYLPSDSVNGSLLTAPWDASQFDQAFNPVLGVSLSPGAEALSQSDAWMQTGLSLGTGVDEGAHGASLFQRLMGKLCALALVAYVASAFLAGTARAGERGQ